MRHHDTIFLWLLLLLPVLALLLAWRSRRRKTTLRFSDITHLKQAPRRGGRFGQRLLWTARLAALALLIVAMARPQQGQTVRRVKSEGIAIALVIDCSRSMAERDFRPNRLEAAKSVIGDFVEGRSSDQICAVIFSAESLLACPLTMDYAILKDLVNRISLSRTSSVIGSSTAIGEGLANALNQLEKAETKSKVVILLTDGSNNAGEISPMKAAEFAKTLGIKVYTIGIGSNRQRQVSQMNGVFTMTMGGGEFDEETLKEIAAATGARYFRADNNRKLKDIYEEIDRLEKQEFELPEYDAFDEKMSPLVWGALWLLLGEVLLAYTLLLKLP